jgi:uncharacterized membrane protein YkvA (DUF1232 family)
VLREYPNEFIDHLGSDQLKRADVGDQIFIIGYENGSMLLLGLLDVDLMVDLPTAQKILGRDNIIKKDLHAIAKDEGYLPCLIPVDDLLPDLDVITADRLERIGLPIHPNRFQTMRRLTEASAKKLHEYYDSEFDGPNNLLERDEEGDCNYSNEYSEEKFLVKVKRYALKAGSEVIEKALCMYEALRDDDTPGWAKTIIIAALGYFISPIDVIPDVAPVVGFTDDLGVLAAAFTSVAVCIKDEHVEKAKATMVRWFG